MIPASTITLNRLLLKLEMELYQRAPGGGELEGEVRVQRKTPPGRIARRRLMCRKTFIISAQDRP